MIIRPDDTPIHHLDRGVERLETRLLSDAGGLIQFGAYVATLPPGAVSSQRHWHSAEDEFLLVLEGSATVVDDDGAHLLAPGDAACWPHGDPNAHHVCNRTDAPVRYLIVGARVAGDQCHYPDEDSVLVNGLTRWQVTRTDGTVLREGDLPDELLNLPAVWGKPYDGTPRPHILRQGEVAAEVCGNNYPAQWSDLGRSEDIALSDAGGLSQFGAFIEILRPGAQTSLRHWHEDEDEFLYVLSGQPMLIENDGPQQIGPGTCVCWQRGVANAHCLRNDTDQPVTLFIVGTRLAEDVAHYPDFDLHYTRRNGKRAFTRKDGTPYPGWPKETNR